VPAWARERIARLSSGPAASLADTLTHPTITNQTSPHFAEALAIPGGLWRLLAVTHSHSCHADLCVLL
jgi:hypothetical protein